MKKIFLLLAIGSTTLIANAQKMKEADVPAEVKTAFAKQYPSVSNAKWEKEDGKYEAAFELKKEELSVLIDDTGKILETESEIAVSALPKVISEYCAKNYSGKKIAEASKIVDFEGSVTYEAEINKMDVLFDANGKFIKESKD